MNEVIILFGAKAIKQKQNALTYSELTMNNFFLLTCANVIKIS
jgi:hypothetical protein